ncbi:MAG: hypothetical protein JO141_17380 [Bradyrhizobium sp.]|nr:hypothetical protein [Bradyrhizobium sp.]
MPSNQDTKNDPHDVLEIAPDVILVARAAAEFPSLAPDAEQPFTRQPNMGNMGAAPDLTAAPRVDNTFRASDVNDIPGYGSGARWLRRAAMAFLFAFVSVFATAAWQRYGNDAQAIAAGFTSHIDVAAWLPWQKSDAATPADTSTPQAAPASVVTATADQATPEAPAAAQRADSTAAAPATAAAPPSPPAQDPTQALQSMSRDMANLSQQIETLKASIAELKANQDQLSREVAKPRTAEARPAEAKPVEHRPAAKLGAPPRPLGTIVQRNPPRPPMYPPMQATAAAPLPPPGSVPVQISPGPPPTAPADASDDGVVVRPPMPVR